MELIGTGGRLAVMLDQVAPPSLVRQRLSGLNPPKAAYTRLELPGAMAMRVQLDVHPIGRDRGDFLRRHDVENPLPKDLFMIHAERISQPDDELVFLFG